MRGPDRVRKPSAALIGSVALHCGVAAVALIGFTANKNEPRALVNSVPVTIVSDMVIEAAAADNPQPEPSLEDGATAPVETTVAPPEPTPAPPEPAPRPPLPRQAEPAPRPVAPPPAKKTEAPRQTPPREPPRTTPPRATTPPKSAEPPRATTPPRNSRPAEREAPGLDLDALAGPSRPTGNTGRPATGQQGRGSAPQAVGRPALQALGAQVRPQLNCDLVDAGEVVRVMVRLDARGRLVRPPQVQGRGTPASARVVSAINAAVPFTMPSGYEEQDLPFAFNTSDFC